jgi:nitroreductase
VFLATRAPSASNRQPWGFIAVTDAHVRARVGDIYARASRAPCERLYDAGSAATLTSCPRIIERGDAGNCLSVFLGAYTPWEPRTPGQPGLKFRTLRQASGVR